MSLLLSCRTFCRCCLSFSFFKNRHLIGSDILKRFVNTARPLHFSAIHLCSITKTEVQAQVVLGLVASAAAHFVHLLLVAGKDRNPCTNSIPVGFLTHGLDQNPILLLAAILQQAGSLVHIVDDD